MIDIKPKFYLVGNSAGVPLRNVVNRQELLKIQKQYEYRGLSVVPMRQGRYFHYYVDNFTDSSMTIQSREISFEHSEPIKLL